MKLEIPMGQQTYGWFAMKMYACNRKHIAQIEHVMSDSLSLLENPKVDFYQRSDNAQSICITSDNNIISLSEMPDFLLLDIRIRSCPEKTVRFLESLAFRLQPDETSVFQLPGERKTRNKYISTGLLFSQPIYSHTTAYQTIEVVEHPAYGKVLMLNDETQIAELDEPIYSRMLADVGWSPAVQKVLILGGGDCGVLREVLKKDVKSVVMIEIDAAVVETAHKYFPQVTANTLASPKVELLHCDAFAYLKTTSHKFDLVICDLSDEPIGDMNNEDLFAMIAKVLKPQARIATHYPSDPLASPSSENEVLTAMKNLFVEIQLKEAFIPSFNERMWEFVSAKMG